MPDRPKDHPPIARRDWREPYDYLLAFATVSSVDERERLRPRLRWACREFRKRTYYLRGINYELEHIPDSERRVAMKDPADPARSWTTRDPHLV
jgi:hypothetical protein